MAYWFDLPIGTKFHDSLTGKKLEVTEAKEDNHACNGCEYIGKCALLEGIGLSCFKNNRKDNKNIILRK